MTRSCDRPAGFPDPTRNPNPIVNLPNRDVNTLYYVSALAFAPSTSIIKNQYATTFQSTLRVQAGASLHWPACELVITHSYEFFDSVVFSPDGGRLASFSSLKGYIWDAQTGEQFLELDAEHDHEDDDDPGRDHDDDVMAVTFSPDGERIASGSWCGTIFIWNAQTGALFGRHNHHDGLKSVAFSPDGERIMSSSLRDYSICISHVSSYMLVTEPFRISDVPVPDYHCSFSVVFFPDGNRIFSYSTYYGIQVWDAWTGKLITGPFEGHTDPIYSAAVSPDGEHIVSGSKDGTICVWNARTTEPVAGP